MTSRNAPSKTSNFSNRWENSLQNNYGTPALTFTSGKGAVLVGENGKRYLDFLGGIATNALGHAHPKIIKAVTEQVKKHSHLSNFYIHEGAVVLAEKLQKMTGSKSARTFFCNSGTEANEAAIKISRLTGRTRIVSTIGGFHGRTAGSLSLTGQPAKQRPFLPLLPRVKHVKFGDLDAMRRVVTRKTAMVIVEPIQGENGVIPAPAGYLEGLRALCDVFGVLLCIDAVQTGMGRTGEWFGYEHSGIKPDIITLAKGLGGGLPLGAMITLGENVPAFAPGDHGSTFGGNPIAVAAALAMIDVIEKERLMKRAALFEKRVRAALQEHPKVAEIRGRGFLLGVRLTTPVAKQVVSDAQEQLLLLNAPNESVIRIAPPLNVTEIQVKKFLAIFTGALDRLGN